MLGTVDRQGSLLGVDSLLARLFEGDESSFYARLAAQGDELISDEDFADCYSAGMGRPSIPPSLLMKAVLLQVRDDVSDREAARRAAKDLDWKRALGLEADEVPFHHTTLSVFRTRLMVNDADQRVLRLTVERAVEVGLFPKKVLAIVDSTGVMGAAAVADTFTLLRQAITRLGDAAGDRIVKRLRRTINRLCRNKVRIDWADAAARRTHLGELVELAKALLAATASHEELAEARDLLARIVDQDVDEEAPDGGGPAIRHGVAPDRVVSVVDPEMRHGHKSASQRIDGYKAHVLSDHDSELVLGVAVTPANDPTAPRPPRWWRRREPPASPSPRCWATPPTATATPGRPSRASGPRSRPRRSCPRPRAASSRPTSSSIPTRPRQPARPGTRPPPRVLAATIRGGRSLC